MAATGRNRRRRLTERIDRARARLELYERREAEILSGGVQSYGIGSRNLSRYQADLAEVRSAIDELIEEIDGLEAQLAGDAVRAAFAVVPMDF